MKILGYGRASTAQQSITCESQKHIIGQYLNVRLQTDWKDGTYLGFLADEAVSSTIPLLHRPMGQRILLNLTDGDILIVSNLDRAFRSVKDCCDTHEILDRAGIRLVIIDTQVDTSTPTGMACLQVLSAMKELERKEIGRRTKEALAHRQRTEQYCTNPPCGWMIRGGTLVPDDATREIGDYIARLIDDDGLSFRTVCRMFIAEGIKHPPSRGKYAGNLIRRVSTISNIYKAKKLGWPKLPFREINRVYDEKHDSLAHPQRLRRLLSCQP